MGKNQAHSSHKNKVCRRSKATKSIYRNNAKGQRIMDNTKRRAGGLEGCVAK